MKMVTRIIGTMLILLAIPLIASAQPQLSLGSATGQPGSQIALPLSISGASGSYAGVNAQIVLPAGVSLVSVTRGALLSGAFTVDANPASRTVIAWSGTGTFSAASGVLLQLNLQIAAGAATGAFPVSFATTNASALVNAKHALSNADGSSVAHSTANGDITISDTSGELTDREKADIIFNWAESIAPSLFPPPTSTDALPGIYFRHYVNTNIYLATYEEILYGIDPDGNLIDLGPVIDWLALAMDDSLSNRSWLAQNQIFSENWERGIIDPSKWNIGGLLLPNIANKGYNSNYSLDINTHHWQSGVVYTQDTFSMPDGLTTTFWLKPHVCSDCDWSSVRIGLVQTDPIAYEENQYDFIVSVRLNPQTATIGYQTMDNTFSEEDYADNDWHEFKIIVDPQGRIAFYRNGLEKAATTIPVDAITTYPNVKFQVYGEDIWGEMLIDDIQLRLFPTKSIPSYSNPWFNKNVPFW